MSLTKRSLGGNKSIIPGHGESLVNDIPAGYGKIENLFYSVGWSLIDKEKELRQGNDNKTKKKILEG